MKRCELYRVGKSTCKNRAKFKVLVNGHWFMYCPKCKKWVARYHKQAYQKTLVVIELPSEDVMVKS